MAKRYFSSILILSLSFCISLMSCRKNSSASSDSDIYGKKADNEIISIKTWDYLGEKYPLLPYIKRIGKLPENAKPWTGTVSHHLLAGDLIDQWFLELSQHRTVKKFFIICPSHWNLSTQEWSLGKIRWETKSGIVQTDDETVDAIAKKLEVTVESNIFVPEHGMNTLIPFIAKYFPGAEIVPIALKHPEPPLNQENAKKFFQVISPYFKDSLKDENFLVISTDFAHHGNYEGTVFKDTRSMEFFKAPGKNTWIFCGCDNRPGLYTLGHILEEDSKSTIIYHTNSFEISGQEENDITSYFFSFIY